jgi:hypothetical protein
MSRVRHWCRSRSMSTTTGSSRILWLSVAVLRPRVVVAWHRCSEDDVGRNGSSGDAGGEVAQALVGSAGVPAQVAERGRHVEVSPVGEHALGLFDDDPAPERPFHGREVFGTAEKAALETSKALLAHLEPAERTALTGLLRRFLEAPEVRQAPEG